MVVNASRRFIMKKNAVGQIARTMAVPQHLRGRSITSGSPAT
jgi:hypothetical protein